MNTNNTISEGYRAEQVRLHLNPNYGVASVGFAPIVGSLLKKNGWSSVADYGAGKKRLQLALMKLGINVDYRPYDPAFPEYGEPRSGDLLCCIDVLEHVEVDLLDNVLEELYRLTTVAGFFSIHTGPAVKVLSDGRNAHLIQENETWWLPRLEPYFHVRQMQSHSMFGRGFWILVTAKR